LTSLSKMIRLRVQRFNPKNNSEPHYDTFQVQTKPGMTVLDALFQVLETQDQSLAFRYSCRSAVCGSCATFINGRQRLACNTQVSKLGSEITIGPLPHIPVIRDLVLDLRPYFTKMHMVKPYFEAREPYPEREFTQSPKDRKAIDVAIDCIDCMACFSSCPLMWTNPKYPGPAAFVKAARFIADTRDSAKHERLALVGCEDGVWRCHTIFNCADACPKSINPTNFVQYLKRRATLPLRRKS
jgi:succinate dehydrogenase / fumarate reductase iron-sulfur subunit